MAERKTISDEFNEEYDFSYQGGKQTAKPGHGIEIRGGSISNATRGINANDNQPSFGVQNARVTASNRLPTEEDQSSPVIQNQTRSLTANNPAQSRRPKTRYLENKFRQKLHPPTKPTIARKTAAVLRASILAVSAFSWTGFLWWWVQLPFASLSIIALGIDAYLRSTWWYEWVKDAWKWVKHGIEYLFGLPEVDFFTLFIIGWLVVVTVGMISLLGVGLQYKLSLLKPLGGSGTSAKYATLLAAVVLYCLPGANFFPWVWLWIVVLVIYPK